jgi:hypothetical protein
MWAGLCYYTLHLQLFETSYFRIILSSDMDTALQNHTRQLSAVGLPPCQEVVAAAAEGAETGVTPAVAVARCQAPHL